MLYVKPPKMGLGTRSAAFPEVHFFHRSQYRTHLILGPDLLFHEQSSGLIHIFPRQAWPRGGLQRFLELGL